MTRAVAVLLLFGLFASAPALAFADTTQSGVNTNNGGQMNQHTAPADQVKRFPKFNHATGKLESELREFPDGKKVHLSFRPDGTLLSKTEIPPVGDTLYFYFDADGRKLVRIIHGNEMEVQVYGKSGQPTYSQHWRRDAHHQFRLHEVEINAGRSRRLVVLKEDGAAIDHVEYQVSGFVGWSTLRSEPGDKLSEPVDPQIFHELNRHDDPSVPANEAEPQK